MLLKATFHYAIQVADLVCDHVCNLDSVMEFGYLQNVIQKTRETTTALSKLNITDSEHTTYIHRQLCSAAVCER